MVAAIVVVIKLAVAGVPESNERSNIDYFLIVDGRLNAIQPTHSNRTFFRDYFLLNT